MKRTLLALLVLISGAVGGYAQTTADYYHEGLVDYQAGKWSQAISFLEGAVQQDPHSWESYQLLSYSYYHAKDIPKSVQSGEASLQINPDNPSLRGFVNKLKTLIVPVPVVEPVAPQAPSGPTDSFYVNLAAVGPYAPVDFTLAYNTGWSLGAGYGFGINRQTSIVLSAQFSNYPLLDPGINGGELHQLTLLANVKFIFVDADNPVVFYGIVGIGLTELFSDSIAEEAVGESGNSLGNLVYPGYSETDLALRLGLGIDIRLEKGLYLYLESNGVDTLVSPNFSFGGIQNNILTNSLVSVGMRFDR